MQKGSLLLFVASLGIAWVHASTTTPAELLAKIEKLQKEVDAIKADDGKMTTDISTLRTEVDSIDGRVTISEMRDAVCGYKNDMHFTEAKPLKFDRVYDEVAGGSGGSLAETGTFTAGVAGTYFITIESTVALGNGEWLEADITLSSGNYVDDKRFLFTKKHNSGADWVRDQSSASRYVKMAAGETMEITLTPGEDGNSDGQIDILHTTMCVSLYSASG